jgi:hypothetical protein
VDIIFPASFVEEVVYSLPYVFGTIVKNQMAVDVWAYFWVFYVSVFVPVPMLFLLLWIGVII